MESIPLDERRGLLSGPSIIIVATYCGTDQEHQHQLSSAYGVVKPDRVRQMQEQAQSAPEHRRRLIEFPRAALAEASPSVKEFLRQNPEAVEIPLYMGQILPGYAMEILDWYGSALAKKNWVDFLTKELFDDFTQNQESSWYPLWIYATMRLLGMHVFAEKMQQLLQARIDGDGEQVDDYGVYMHILNQVSEDDPVVLYLTTKYARLAALADDGGIVSGEDMEL